ncbi:glycosyl hydrolase family 18 protein [Brevibacillus parabrevis]|uniref:glycosyl hydrolase family 18 protein n=1 Tax=Brevibacillus parabrevis TaxID=54914 RepID=UPI001C250480|nr:glycosyl hydrolase family 18 protein [Brevibacillus parabrevis]MBU8713306.1 LysM peptidoglycan-binding domain-containing protein [Brevibacillus parabrevis]MDR4997505.1 glycosyl hydrolase family 18 protein [Brevibacillus parabrevis]
MFIYTVKPGDSLYSVAAKFEVPMAVLQSTNGLTVTTLVPGQDLVIPTKTYIVQPGDSLYAIAQMSFVTPKALQEANGLTSYALTPGKRLRLPTRAKYPVENFSYLLLTTPENDEKIIVNSAANNTYYGIFEHHLLPGGALSQLDDAAVIRASRRHHVAPLAVITNLTATGFNAELVRQILNSREQTQRLIDNIYTLVRTKNYAGANIDFELVRPQERDLYTNFLRALRQRLKPHGYFLSVALPAKTNDEVEWLKGYDYKGIGAAVDFVFLMTYDYHEAGSEPGPVAPIGEVRRTIEYAISQMNRKKIILGVARYGYNWMMQGDNVVSAQPVRVADAVQLSMRYSVPIQFSAEYQQPHFTYWDENGRKHIVWFENVRGRAEKYRLVYEYRLRGVGAWQLGFEFPQSKVLIPFFFTVKKVI